MAESYPFVPKPLFSWCKTENICLPHAVTVRGPKAVGSRFGELCLSRHFLLLLSLWPSRTAGSKLPVSKNCNAFWKEHPLVTHQPLGGRIKVVVAANPADMGCNIVNYHLFCSLDEKNKCNYTHECWKMKQSNVDRHIWGAFPNEKLPTMNANGLPPSCSLAYGAMWSFWIKRAAVPSAWPWEQ